MFNNEQNGKNPTTTRVNTGDSGDKLTPAAVYAEVERRVKAGESVRGASAVIAGRAGKREATVRKMYVREKVGRGAKAL